MQSCCNDSTCILSVLYLLAWCFQAVVGEEVWGAFPRGMDELYSQGGVEGACFGVLAPQAAGVEKRSREGEGEVEGRGGRRGEGEVEGRGRRSGEGEGRGRNS